jgi:hypothetical protein
MSWGRMENKPNPEEYDIGLYPSQEVGIHCVYVEVSSKEGVWNNGPIITDEKDFFVLTESTKKKITLQGSDIYKLEALLDAAEEGENLLNPVHIRMVIANCDLNKRYLFITDGDEFMSEEDLIEYALEGENE